MLFCALYQFCKIAFQSVGAPGQSDDVRPVTISGQSHEPRHNVTNVITDNELSRPELTMENSWEEIINALEVEKIQKYLEPPTMPTCTARKQRAMALFWMLTIERVIE